ncbi:MAG: hypothetical protein QW327_02030, partial [Candidatus Odinarchaeota archaeon]
SSNLLINCITFYIYIAILLSAGGGLVEAALKHSRNTIIYIAILLLIALVFNLVSLGIIQVDSRLQLALLAVLLVWISVGVAILVRWLVKIFRSF